MTSKLNSFCREDITSVNNFKMKTNNSSYLQNHRSVKIILRCYGWESFASEQHSGKIEYLSFADSTDEHRYHHFVVGLIFSRTFFNLFQLKASNLSPPQLSATTSWGWKTKAFGVETTKLLNMSRYWIIKRRKEKSFSFFVKPINSKPESNEVALTDINFCEKIFDISIPSSQKFSPKNLIFRKPPMKSWVIFSSLLAFVGWVYWWKELSKDGKIPLYRL